MHLAGLQIAFDAFKSHPSLHLVQGLPSLQKYYSPAVFFIAYGQVSEKFCISFFNR